MEPETSKIPQGGSELARDLRPHPQKGYSSLRRHRWSAPGFRYFVTFCTEDRRAGLHLPPILSALKTESGAIQHDRGWHMRASVIMPDHVHLFLELGEMMPLGRLIARLKTKTSPALRINEMLWQAGYFERRLRESDSALSVIHYLAMNPVRAGLCAKPSDWPGFHCCEEDWHWYAKERLPAAGAEPDWFAVAEGGSRPMKGKGGSELARDRLTSESREQARSHL